jgi:hypothetical protein
VFVEATVVYTVSPGTQVQLAPVLATTFARPSDSATVVFEQSPIYAELGYFEAQVRYAQASPDKLFIVFEASHDRIKVHVEVPRNRTDVESLRSAAEEVVEAVTNGLQSNGVHVKGAKLIFNDDRSNYIGIKGETLDWTDYLKAKPIEKLWAEAYLGSVTALLSWAAGLTVNAILVNIGGAILASIAWFAVKVGLSNRKQPIVYKTFAGKE